jgi:hypothetical protein
MMRERPNHTLQPSAPVNEAYLRLGGYQRVQWQNRTQFFAIAAQLMRRILVLIAPGGANQFPGWTFTRCGAAPFHGARGSQASLDWCALVFRWFFCSVYDQNFDRTLASFQFQSKIFLKHCEQRRKGTRFSGRFVARRGRLIRCPRTGPDFEKACYSSRIHDGPVRKTGEVLSKIRHIDSEGSDAAAHSSQKPALASDISNGNS